MPVSMVQRTVFNDLSIGVSLLSKWESKEMKMLKERNWKTQFNQMSLRLVNEPQPMLSETMREELIFALAALLLDAVDGEDIAQGAHCCPKHRDLQQSAIEFIRFFRHSRECGNLGPAKVGFPHSRE